MSFGVIMLVHTAFDRAEQVARHWQAAGCQIVVHIDKSSPEAEVERFRSRLADLPNIRFCPRFRCEWGTWGIIAATQSAAEMMLREAPEVDHILLTSGACLPLRPVSQLASYLAARPTTDFIESVNATDIPWTIGGLDKERFSMRFPFSWKRNRFLFDKFVKLQRIIGVRRRPPHGLQPHMGSQWWCLSRKTLAAILSDSKRPEFDRYFRGVWIPDESYFQSLARLHSTHIESRSLTLAKFDFQGKPHVFYDDHLQLLRRSDCFIARKIWPHAQKLYEAFPASSHTLNAEPNPGRINRVFTKALEQRTKGRPGLYMQSRFPNAHWENGITSEEYSVFQGFSYLFEDFNTWLATLSNARLHGHLFSPDRAVFSHRQEVIEGALTDTASLRDRNPRAFLTNFIWNTRGQRQAFHFGPEDNQKISPVLAADANASITVISGAWALPLFRSQAKLSEIQKRAAKLQRIEHAHLQQLRSKWVKARVQIFTLSECLEVPKEPLHAALASLGVAPNLYGVAHYPQIPNLDGFEAFLQQLKNHGMNPHLLGEFPIAQSQEAIAESASRRRHMMLQ